jgi:hypothetical protein
VRENLEKLDALFALFASSPFDEKEFLLVPGLRVGLRVEVW